MLRILCQLLYSTALALMFFLRQHCVAILNTAKHNRCIQVAPRTLYDTSANTTTSVKRALAHKCMASDLLLATQSPLTIAGGPVWFGNLGF
jgi:hypothetical protein